MTKSLTCGGRDRKGHAVFIAICRGKRACNGSSRKGYTTVLIFMKITRKVPDIAFLRIALRHLPVSLHIFFNNFRPDVPFLFPHSQFDPMAIMTLHVEKEICKYHFKDKKDDHVLRVFEYIRNGPYAPYPTARQPYPDIHTEYALVSTQGRGQRLHGGQTLEELCPSPSGPGVCDVVQPPSESH